MEFHAAIDAIETPPQGPRPRLLVVDENTAIQQLVRRVLGTRDFEVHIADDVGHAMNLASVLRFDAAVVALGIPDEASGVRLLRWFRSHQNYATLPLLILTGRLDLSEAVQELIRPLQAYVFFKGSSLAALVEQLNQLLPRTALRVPPVGAISSAA